ncbi:NAD(P)-dependent oxidoreductase [Streptomyces sp. NPDC020412]|uniref:NAD(P)-dependent oxidoreductase n=1 Tax=Streptomyces sp. NPDC020412 TaxID=3365073 RepID=UPI0037AF3C64
MTHTHQTGSRTGGGAGIVVFGAGGRVGRAAVAEAVRRGHPVTAVVRDPARHRDLAGDGVTVARGDATDAASVAALAPGHLAAVNAAVRLDVSAEEFFVAAAKAMVSGLTRAGVRRFLTLGVASTLEVSPGVRMMDEPDFPEPYRVFSQGHAAEFDALRALADALDWLVVCPPLELAAEVPSTGRYRTADGTLFDGGGRISHADLALALLDEVEAPRHHRIQLAVSA